MTLATLGSARPADEPAAGTADASRPVGLLWLWRRHAERHRRALSLAAALQLIQVAATLYLPTINADIVDKGIVPDDTGYVLTRGGVMLGVTVLQVAAAVAATYLSARTALRVGRDVRGELFDRVQHLPPATVERLGVASLTMRTTNDVQQVQLLTSMSLTLLVGAPLTCIGGIVLAARLDLSLSTLFFLAIPCLLAAVLLVLRVMRPASIAMQRHLDRANTLLREQVAGTRVIRIFTGEAREQQRFTAADEQLIESALRAGKATATLYPAVLIVMNLSSVAVLWFGGHLVGDGHMQIGVIGAFVNYLMQILTSVMASTLVIGMLPRGSAAAARIGAVLRAPVRPGPTGDVRPAPTGPDDARGLTVRLDRVDYRYGGAATPVLRGLELEFPAGTTTAVVGSTGSGKSTLLKLAAGLFVPSDGTVRVGPTDPARAPSAYRAATVGLAPQRAFLFSGTVASNLRQAAPHATDDQLWHALDIAAARDVVDGLGGLDAVVAPSGAGLSGGQRQRLARR